MLLVEASAEPPEVKGCHHDGDCDVGLSMIAQPPSLVTITIMQQLFGDDRNYGSTHESHSNDLPGQYTTDLTDRKTAAATVGSTYYSSISSDASGSTSASWSFASVEELQSTEVLPLNRPDIQDHKRNSTNADVHLSMVSNFSAAYNTINISLALALMQSAHPPEDSSSISKCSSALIAGMILGQLGGGLLGDWLGRHMAMAVVMTVQIGAAFMSSWSGVIFVGRNIHSELACWRFLLGVGCGGVYPLAATITAESSPKTENKSKSVALMFSFQGVGYLAVSLIAYVLVCIFGEESDLAWRLLLGLGSLPGLVLIVTRIQHRRKEANQITHKITQGNIEEVPSNDTDNLSNFNTTMQRERSQVRLPATSLLDLIWNEPNLLRKIVGTAGCWLLFDILFYGNTLFQPVVLSAAFGESETIHATLRDSIFISLMALPGYFMSVVMVGRQSPKRIQFQGFLCMAALYMAIGLKFDELNRISLLGLYGLTFFFSNYGPNSTVSSTKYDLPRAYTSLFLTLLTYYFITDFYAAEHDVLASVPIDP